MPVTRTHTQTEREREREREGGRERERDLEDHDRDTHTERHTQTHLKDHDGEPAAGRLAQHLGRELVGVAHVQPEHDDVRHQRHYRYV